MERANPEWVKEAYSKCITKYRKLIEEGRGEISVLYDDTDPYEGKLASYNWTNGFQAGILWQIYRFTKLPEYKELAQRIEGLMDGYFDEYMALDHDVGFVWIPSAVFDYRLTGNKRSKVRAMHAANILAGRFNIAGEFIRAWNSDGGKNDKTGWSIIDCMMNIPLLYWASEQLGDPRYAMIADAHAHTVMECFVREDGSVNHIVEFQPETGNFLRTYGGQGYRVGSAWTRGQGWAIYGFVTAYKMSKKEEYLDTAKRVADYFISKIPKDGHVPIDFDQPESVGLEDSSAAAIAACGLLEISFALERQGKEGDGYKRTAIWLLQVLNLEECDYSGQKDAIVQNCAGSYHETKWHHATLIYADYFYMEALEKILYSSTEFIW